MSCTYYRRYRMEFDFARNPLDDPVLPDGFRWERWHLGLVRRHAAVKYTAFREEVDARVFPCLAHFDGCHDLMSEIVRQNSFLPRATWLVSQPLTDFRTPLDCGTIQGLAQNRRLGAVQNVGVVPECRGLGLGRALVLKSLHGFRESGLRRVALEVTADNAAAVELYRSIGFRLTRTLYKAVEFAEAPV